ncbi:MAG: adenylate/guanylate cyclase domain-containing protein, partial [Dietzia sp.]|nr:adenylate/guanylate cyclase domain-containing protein [Dietzia sp.]
IAFADPGDAVRCSVSVQQALKKNPERYDDIRVRIGAHAGSSVRRGDDLFGRNVAMAARIADLAGGGEILVSQELREALDDPDGVVFEASLEVELKGLRGTQTVYSVSVPPAH